MPASFPWVEVPPGLVGGCRLASHGGQNENTGLSLLQSCVHYAVKDDLGLLPLPIQCRDFWQVLPYLYLIYMTLGMKPRAVLQQTSSAAEV